MLTHDCKCSECGTQFDVYESLVFFTRDSDKEFETLDQVECPKCHSTKKEIRDFEEY